MRGKGLWSCLLICILMLAACGGAAEQYTASYDMGDSSANTRYSEEAAIEAEGNASAPSFYDEDGNSGEAPILNDAVPAQNQTVERLIIRNGTLNLVVTDTEEVLQEISRLTQQREGWVVSSNVYDYYPDAKAGTIYIRVPVAQFDTIMDAIKAMAVEVTSESTNSEDVTNQYVDLSARLSNLEATATRVRAFLDDARNVEEALAVNQELSRLEGEIEVLTGQIQYLSQSASFSSITVNLTPDEATQPVSVAGWRPQGVAKDALENLIATLQNLADFLIYFVISGVPLLLLFGIPLFLIIRWGWRRWRRAVPAAASTKAP